MGLRMIRAVIDVQTVTPQRSGIGEFTRQVTLNLLRHFHHRISLSLYDGTRIAPVRSEEDCEKFWQRMRPGSIYAVRHQFRLPLLLSPKAHDIFLSPDFIIPLLNVRVPMVAVIHDLIPLIMDVQGTRKAKMLPLYRAVCKMTLARCARVLTVSEHSKHDIINLLAGDNTRIDVVYSGVETIDHPTPPVSPLLHRLQPQRYFLYVGRSDLYKGIDTLISAFRRFKDKHAGPFSLVLAGAVSRNHEEYYRAILSDGPYRDDIIQAGYVPESELAWLYLNANALVHPSLYEGFGVPPVQAMACGTPVVCSNRASIPEITGGAALMIDPLDDEQFTAALLRIVEDSDLRSAYIEKGKERAQLYQWKYTAEHVLASFERALSA
jgi:glycosyltransferase involved in cell wall biosynthesis